jgi:hypothetical protein
MLEGSVSGWETFASWGKHHSREINISATALAQLNKHSKPHCLAIKTATPSPEDYRNGTT